MYRNPFEHIVNLLTYETCRICKIAEGPVCTACLEQIASDEVSRCYNCNKLTKDHRVCGSCVSALRRVWWLGIYKNELCELIGALKYKRSRELGRQFGGAMANSLPYLNENTLVVAVPTAASRIRRRGYDQAELLAKSITRHKKLCYAKVLVRTNQSDQIGKRRSERIKQMEDSFSVRKNSDVRGASILLVDDVLTTGATLESAAKVLRIAGAKHVDAVVVARHLLK